MRNIVKGLLLFAVLASTPQLSHWLHTKYLYNYKGQSIVYLRGEVSGGTGFQVDAGNGKIYTLTNKHICKLQDKHNRLEYEKNNGDKGYIKVIDVSKTHDLCILEAVPNIKPLSLAFFANTTDDVWLSGHPGLRALTLERGHLAAYTEIEILDACTELELLLTKIDLEREFNEVMKTCDEKPLACSRDIDRISQETLAMVLGYCLKEYPAAYITTISYGGNSGSPVLNRWGRVVGVLFAGDRTQSTSSYMVPLWEVKKFINKERK